MAIWATSLPFFLLLILTVVARRPLWQSGIISLAFAAILWLRVEGVSLSFLAAPMVKALVVSTEVGLILIGAIAFLELMQKRGTTERIKAALDGFSSGNPAFEALLLAWFFCGFLEGAAGFGAPAALIAPLLCSIGFSPMVAAILPLIGDSAAVPFGAVGTPVRVGFDGLAAETAGPYGAAINLFAGLVPPIAIYWISRRYDKSEKPRLSTKRGLLVAVWAGLCFTVPSFLLAWIGPEFPSIGGAMIGLLIFSVTLRKLGPEAKDQSETTFTAIKRLALSFSPYLILCLVLIIGKQLIGSVKCSVEMYGKPIVFNAFQPGALFIVTIIGLYLSGNRSQTLLFEEIFLPAIRRLPFVWIAIFCMAGLAQFVIQISDLAESLNAVFGGNSGAMLLLILAPVAGAIGSFIAGSATVSNLLFAPILFQACQMTGLEPGLVLGLQLVGAGAGNMISLQNLAAVQATVGMTNRESDMLKQLWLPCLGTLLVAILIGLALRISDPNLSRISGAGRNALGTVVPGHHVFDRI